MTRPSSAPRSMLIAAAAAVVGLATSALVLSSGHFDDRRVREISDDGIGGASPTTGSGLHGLSDRIAALDGAFEVESPAGGGTRLRLELPCT